MNTYSTNFNDETCTIAFNDYNQMILYSANNTFLRKLCLSDRNIGSAIDNIFPKDFISFLHILYTQNVNNREILSKYYSLKSLFDEPLPLIVTLNNACDSPYFICKALEIIPSNYDFFSSSYCKIKNGEIVALSEELCNLVEQHNLVLEELLKSEAVQSATKSGMPQVKLFIFPTKGASSLHTLSAIPSNSSSCDFTLYVNDIPSENPLHNIQLLTSRELEILKLASKGFSNRIIANTLNITEGCVSKILSNAYAKLEISSKIEILNLL